MRVVYVVQHSYEHAGTEDVKLIGVFSSEARAQESIDQLRSMPGFRDYPRGFHIDRYELDLVNWSEGFIGP